MEFNENSLYAEQTKTQQNGNSQDEWTWIEVIDDKEEDGLIIVQTDESTRIRNMKSLPPSVNKRKRGMSKYDSISRKVFKRSLYTDLPLMRKATRCSRTLKTKPTLPLDVQIRRFCKAHQTTSEVLATTFPTNELFTVRNEFDCDVSYLLNNTTFLKNILEAILKHKIRLNRKLKFLYT